MAMATGLLALAILGAEGPTAPGGGGETINYQVRVASLDGLAWRTSAYARLRPVARQGSATVWTADRALAARLAGSAVEVTVTPKCSLAAEATIGRQSSTYFVEHCERVADGPINGASSVAWKPEVGRVDEGFRSQISGRRLDQGILARVSLEETHVKAIHVYDQAETVQATDQIGVDFDWKPAGAAGPGPRMNLIVSKGQPTKVACRVQVPEVSQSRVEGEWLIPHDGVLLVSLGVETVADDKGKAIVRDRVAIVEFNAPTAPEACPRDDRAATPSPDPVTLAPAADAPPVVVGALPMPALLERSLPQGFDPKGEPVELPPLPEALASADLDRIKPEPNQPTPQAPHVGPAPMPVGLASANLDRIKPDPSRPGAKAAPKSSGPVADAQVARSSFQPSSRVEAPGAVDRRAEGMTRWEGTPVELFASRPDLLGKLLSAIQRRGFDVDIASDGSSVTLSPCDDPACDDEGCPAGAASPMPRAGDPADCREVIGADVILSPFAVRVVGWLERMGLNLPDEAADDDPIASAEQLRAMNIVGRVVELFVRLGMATIEVEPAPGPSEPGKVDAAAAPAMMKAGDHADCRQALGGGDDADECSSFAGLVRECLGGLGMTTPPAPCKNIGIGRPAADPADEPSAPVSTPSASKLDLSAALKTPGRTETAYLPLGGNLTLEIKATVVPTPPERVAPVVGQDRYDRDGFWFLAQPSRMTPFPTQADRKP